MSARKGFSLIEIMVAMTILSIVLLSLAKISTAITVRARTSDIVAKRVAALQREANKLGAVPFNSLGTWPTSAKVDTLGTFRYTRQLTITQQGASRFTVKIVVIPTAAPTKKDSITLERTLPPTGSPLCTGC